MGKRRRCSVLAGLLGAACTFLPVLAAAGGDPPAPHCSDDRAENICWVPPGDFWMGRTRLWLIDEIHWQTRDRVDARPVHRVTLPGFWIDQKEVTQKAYREFTRSTGRPEPFHWRQGFPEEKGRFPIYKRQLERRQRVLRIPGKAAANRGRMGEGRPGRARGSAVAVGRSVPARSGRGRSRGNPGAATGPHRPSRFTDRRGVLSAQRLRPLRHGREHRGMGGGRLRPRLLRGEPAGRAAGAAGRALPDLPGAGVGRTPTNGSPASSTGTSRDPTPGFTASASAAHSIIHETEKHNDHHPDQRNGTP